MKTSDKGINKLKELEGAVKIGNMHVVYDDKTGKPIDVNKILPYGATIGYGHLIKHGEDFCNGITEATATELLRSDIATAECAVQNSIRVPITQNQFDALVIFAYNIGAKNFTNSTVVKYINNPNFHSAIYTTLKSAWIAWNRTHGVASDGLRNRRMCEWQIYVNGIY